MAYLLDANIFIQAKNLHYGFDFCPAFWDWLIQKNHHGKVFSIEKIGDELVAGNDNLAEWARDRGKGFFLEPDTPIQSAFGEVSEWVISENYKEAAINTFFQVADFYLIAFALAHRHIVVTHEVAIQSKTKIKIPNVCIGVGVKCVTPYEMLRIEKARFVLGNAKN